MKTYSNEEKIEIFTVLYPLFKREVYDRRDQILKIASLSSGFFLILVLVISFFKSYGITLQNHFYPVLIGILFFEAGIGYHLYQHKIRHEKAKRLLIDLEERMGFFNEGVFEVSKPLFPGEWKLRGVDPGFFFYPFIHSGLIVLLIYLLF